MSIEDRLRLAAENILENSTLAGDLQDDEASQLLEWGLVIASNVAQSTHLVDDGEAELLLDDGLRALRRTMRRVGRLVGRLGELDADAAQALLRKALEAAAILPGTQVRMPQDANSELEALRGLSPAESLQRVLNWINQPEEGTDGEET